MVRSILAVVAGYLTFSISAVVLFQVSGIHPHSTPGWSFVVFSVVYGCVFAVLGGYLAGWIAKHNELKHSVAVTLLMAVTSVVSLFLAEGDKWTQLATIFIMSPCAVLGGFLRKKRIQPDHLV